MNELPLEIDCNSVSQLLTQQADMLLLDCREADEYALVAIDGAQLLPMSEIAERCSELDGHQQAQIVVYCHHGMRSRQVAQWLRQQGFSHAQSMSGGIDRWATEIDPSLPRY